MEIKLFDAESKTQSDEVNEQLERWEEPNVQLEGEIKNCRRGNGQAALLVDGAR